MSTKRVICFVDGFNVYHSLVENSTLHKYKWLDLKAFVTQFINTARETLDGIYYFSALCTWDQAKRNRHTAYIRALENTGVNVVLGGFKMKYPRCRLCHRNYEIPEEKETDVNIALFLLDLAYQDAFDTAIVISGDSDFTPAIKMVKQRFPEKRLGVFFPPNRSKGKKELKKLTDFNYKISAANFVDKRLPDPYTLSDGTTLTCPAHWS